MNHADQDKGRGNEGGLTSILLKVHDAKMDGGKAAGVTNQQGRLSLAIQKWLDEGPKEEHFHGLFGARQSHAGTEDCGLEILDESTST